MSGFKITTRKPMRIQLTHSVYNYLVFLSNKAQKFYLFFFRREAFFSSMIFFIASRFLVLCECLDFFFMLSVVPLFAI
ncbi:MAG: hypothetical protein WCO07_03440 [bacterium]